MDIAAAEVLRDEFIVRARSLAQGVLEKKSVAKWLGGRLGLLAAPTPPATLSVGILLGSGPGEAGIAVRSTIPIDPLETLFLGSLRERASRIDVKVITPVVAEQDTWQGPGTQPPRIGSRVGHPFDGPGTLGAFVRHRRSGKYAILSNNHVLARSNRASINDRTLFYWIEGGIQQLEIGRLKDFEPLKGSGAANKMDAAFSVIEGLPGNPGDVAGEIRLSGEVVDPVERVEVRKFGARTGFTKGVIKSARFNDLDMWYPETVCRFDEQIEIESSNDEPFSEKGDSGSLVVTSSGDAVGLLIGGARTDGGNLKLSYACPIGPVLHRFGLDLVN